MSFEPAGLDLPKTVTVTPSCFLHVAFCLRSIESVPKSQHALKDRSLTRFDLLDITGFNFFYVVFVVTKLSRYLHLLANPPLKEKAPN